MQKIYALLFFIFPLTVIAQTPIPKNGVELGKTNSVTLKNVTIIVSPTKTIERGFVVIREGKISEVGSSLKVPTDIPSIDMTGKIIVPAFIEVVSSLGIPELKGKGDFFPQLESNKTGAYYWNEAIHPEIDPTELYSIDGKAIDELHKMGYGFAVVHQNDGIAQGSGTLVSLGKDNVGEQLLKSEVASYFSFRKGVSDQTYPSSQMGSIALLRQAFYDAQWHNQYGKTPNYSLEALTRQEKIPAIFQTTEKYELLRAYAISKEFKRKFTYLGTGQEYSLGNSLDTINSVLVIPINFPESYDLKDPYVARQIPFSDLKHWELASSNPSFLQQHKQAFITTTQGNKTAADFWKNIHRALAKGWTVQDALRSMTTAPAELLGIQAEAGTIEKGKWASFSVFDKNPFLMEAQLLETFTKGERAIKVIAVEADIRGMYSMNIDGAKYLLDIKGTAQKPDAKVKYPRTIADSITGLQKPDTLNADAVLLYSENDMVVQFLLKDKERTEHFSLKGVMNPRIFIAEGDGTNTQGRWIKWTAIRNKAFEEKEKPKNAWELDTTEQAKPLYPNMAYGFDTIPTRETIVIKNATVWTNESEGNLQNATVLVENGKIKAVYANTATYPSPANARVIDAQGKHLTSGIIDEHSHVAISKGVNEGGQAISAEVRIGDVINAEDINVYRQLSGGVTAAQLLHGSANPVGGQSALVKLKWGHLPSDYLIPNAPKFVKFALGENVKQANWGDFNTVRFPQTRMGVEQVFIDGFSRAITYHDNMTKFELQTDKQKAKNTELPPARDLELDALYEIVKGERRITCHSYVQSEINMLMHVADSFGFKVNTFTHILEGYKVADKMKEHGVGASTFADWWAYKFEVKDAVPYNASLMNAMGIVVAINSDDAEMGRRLNQEAAKTIKYGGVSELDAWKMVTLNPAKLLRLDDKMGSIKVGKDADLVLWTTNPLSVEAKVLYTIVDGEVLYDAASDIARREEMEAERARIIAKMSDSNKKGETTKPFVRKRKGHFHCDTLGEEYAEGANEH